MDNATPLTDADYPSRNAAKEKLGKFLFYDKILSGNKNISCASCHHAITASGDGLSLSVGEGGQGLGVTRDTGMGANAIHERVLRNASDDFGRDQVTGNPADRYRFRTPSLRNVTITGPWGHDGAYNTLEGILRHHIDAVNRLQAYDVGQAVLPSRSDLDAADFNIHNDPASRAALAGSIELGPIQLSDEDVAALIEFLHALADTASLDLRSTVPMRVPSGLPIRD
jgi:Cytochrome c peroxidase